MDRHNECNLLNWFQNARKGNRIEQRWEKWFRTEKTNMDKKNQLDVNFVFFISLLIFAQHVSGNHVPMDGFVKRTHSLTH